MTPGLVSYCGTLGDFDDLAEPATGCASGGGGRDLSFEFQIPAGTWDVELSTLASAVDTQLTVSLACGGAGLCNDDANPTTGKGSRVWLHRFGTSTPLTFYVTVDGASASDIGDFELAIRLESADPDACLSLGGDMPLDISGGGTVWGLSSGSLGSTSGSCQGGPALGVEAIFFVNPAASGTASFEARSTEFIPDLYVRSGACSSGSELGCASGSAVGGGVAAATLDVAVGPGNNFVFVDGGPGSYSLEYMP